MSLNDTIGQQLPDDDAHDRVWSKVERTIRTMNENRRPLYRWFWRGLLAFNLILASLVFWLRIVPSLI